MFDVAKPNPYGALNSENLSRFEQQIGMQLPLDYRSFLEKYNGGNPAPTHFPVTELGGVGKLHHVYGLHKGPAYCRLDAVWKIFQGRVPPAVIPVADDEGGNQICLGISGKHRGKVYFWDHEREGDAKAQSTWHNVSLIATSFALFLESLHDPIDPNVTDTDTLITNNDIEGVRRLLASGYKLESKDDLKRTLLENATIQNKIEIVRFLVASGAKLRKAKYYAELNDHKELLSYLQSLG